MKKKAEKEKNELGSVYENATRFYPQVATTWKKNCLTESEYQSFIRIEVYKQDTGDVAHKYHQKIEILRNLIANQARIVRELQAPQNNLFTNPNLLK